MSPEQLQALDKLQKMEQQHSHDWSNYWMYFSNLRTWGFWANVVLLVLPLVVLYFYIDRSKAFRIGFYGFNIHVWLTYSDTFGTLNGFWEYPYKLLPFMSRSFAVDASLVPVAYMLVYQWTLNHQKNYYLYATGTSIFFAGVVKPLMVLFGLFKFFRGATYLHLFIGFMIVMLISKWLTDLFAHWKIHPDELKTVKKTLPSPFRMRDRA